MATVGYLVNQTNDCIVCGPGTSCPVGSGEPSDCLPGSYGTSAGQQRCNLCPAGKFARTFGSTACMACSCGHFCSRGAAVPSPCPAGRYSNEMGLQHADNCSICAVGSACTIGSREPAACGPGSFSNETGLSECTLCDAAGAQPGLYQEESGQTACKQCSPGRYSANILSCEPCVVGEYCEQGVQVGTSCGATRTTFASGAASETDCVCKIGMVNALQRKTQSALNV
jgi:hypothetical protein